MIIHAMSKVNLALDVLRKRADGYHDVKMVMQTLNLYDELNIETREDDKIVITSNEEDLECDERNLIYKAAKLLMEEAGVWKGFTVKLKKNIPIAAGMAGGSTDAAATLVAVNNLLGLNKSVDELKAIAVKIGADVPYCVEGGTQLSEGIGEKLTILSPAPKCFVVVVKPFIGVSTRYVYENLFVDTIKKHPDVDKMIDNINAGDLQGVAVSMENILENVTEKQYPVIGMLKAMLKNEGALNAIMSGSGPTVFGLFDDEQKANAALKEVFNTGEVSQGFVTTFADKNCVIVEK